MRRFLCVLVVTAITTQAPAQFRYWVSARGLPPGRHQIHEFDANGVYTGRSSDAVPGAQQSSWGYRDGAADGEYMYFGWEGGVARHDRDGAKGTQIIFGPAPGGVGTWRALSFDPDLDAGRGGFWVAGFSSALVATRMDGSLLRSLPGGNWLLCGLSAVKDEPDYLWGHTIGGTVIKISKATGMVVPGGWPNGFPNLVGHGGLSTLKDSAGYPRTFEVAAIAQGAPDELGAYDSRLGKLIKGPWPLTGPAGIGSLGVAVALGTCPGDVNNDRFVGPQDLTLLLAAWYSQPGPAPSARWNGNADFDCDSFIGPQDLTILLAHWFERCP